ncbi:MAG: class I SAM-dependent methyltransferase [Thermodesulfobacteriota bacterium]|nr:class I SAM-dependent methyltransferase [Thermodesulfobacteriota bacterium]
MIRNSGVRCRSCGQPGLEVFLDLGKTPLADRLLTEKQLKQPESHHPLEAAFCSNCSLVQILETVPPERLFCDEYPYYSSFSPSLLAHSRENASHLIKTRGLGTESYVVELASNDGYLLKNYLDAAIRCLGIDPAEGPAKAAEKIGVPTKCAFFTEQLARQFRDEGKRADVIHANNVLAHVQDTNGFVRGISILLKDNGVAVIEVPYVKDMVDHCEFDTIYHEHLCYFSVTALDNLFRRHGLFINDLKRLPIHGGSLRLYVGHVDSPSDAVQSLVKHEQKEGVDQLMYYADFSAKVNRVKDSLLDLLDSLKRQGKRIAAYGAAAKGATLINYVGVGKDLLDFVVDRNVHKQGKYMPGKHLPIFGTERLLEELPDYVLLLAWNFAKEIVEQQSDYCQRGGRFILPVPEPRVI